MKGNKIVKKNRTLKEYIESQPYNEVENVKMQLRNVIMVTKVVFNNYLRGTSRVPKIAQAVLNNHVKEVLDFDTPYEKNKHASKPRRSSKLKTAHA